MGEHTTGWVYVIVNDSIPNKMLGLLRKLFGEKGRKKTHAILGLVLSSVAVFGVIFLMITVHKEEQQRIERLKAAYEEYKNRTRHLR